MQYIKPTRYRVTSTLKKYHNEATGNESYRCFVMDQGEPLNMKDFFLNTKGQLENTIVHSKLSTGGKGIDVLGQAPFEPNGWLASSRPNVAWCQHGDTLTLVTDTCWPTAVDPMHKEIGDPISARQHQVTIYCYKSENGGMQEDALTAAWTSHFDGNYIPSEEEELSGIRLDVSLFVRSKERPVFTDNTAYARDVCFGLAQAYTYPLPSSRRRTISSVFRLPEGWNAPKSPAGALLFAEDAMFFDGLPPGVAVSPEAGGLLEKAKYQAYKMACDRVPRLSDNMISNVIEAIGALGSLARGRVDLPDSWASGWLFYRYAYSTTKMDIEEAKDYLRRLPTLPSTYKAYGSYTFNYKDVEVTVRCRLKLFNPLAHSLNKISYDMRTYGLKLGAYQIWDLIPFSFVADWFLPIGGMLQESQMVEYANTYRISAPVYSISYNRSLDSWEYNVYSRWVGTAPQSIDGLVWYEDSKPSPKTIGKRVIDSLALILG